MKINHETSYLKYLTRQISVNKINSMFNGYLIIKRERVH